MKIKQSENDHGWMQTFTRKKFYPFQPQESLIDIRDIAHALSNLCRFAGHGDAFYSVAEHSLLVSEVLKYYGFGPEIQLAGLLHDSTEAYMNDLISPVKHGIDQYMKAEKHLSGLIEKRFGVSFDWKPIHEVDRRLALNECNELMGGPVDWRGNHVIPLPTPCVNFRFFGPLEAEEPFLKLYVSLTNSISDEEEQKEVLYG